MFRSTLSQLPYPLKQFLHTLRVWQIKRRQVGTGVYIDPTAQALGWEHLAIGQYSVVCEGVWFNINFRQPNTLAIRIGENCFIGRRSVLSSGELIQLGDYCTLGVNSLLLGAGHYLDDPFTPYANASPEPYGQIILGANVWLTSNVTVLKDVTIGFGTVIGANSLITKSLPPLCIAVGQPARIIKLFDVPHNQWVVVDERDPTFPAQLQQHLDHLMDEATYLQRLKAARPRIFAPPPVAGIAGGEV